jgi:EpsI family protein
MIKASIGVFVLLIPTAFFHNAILDSQREASKKKTTEAIMELPDRIGGYTRRAYDEEVSQRVKEVLETSQILLATYDSPRGYPVSLSIVHAGKTRRSLHFPEVCITGAGFEVREQYTDNVGFMFTAKHLVVYKGKQQEAVLYWFKTGDQFTGSFYVNSLKWAKEQLMFGVPTSTMVRVSTPIIDGNQERAFTILKDFALKLAPIVKKNIP